jgi:glutamine amidotransferase
MISIVDYGGANLGSILNMLRRVEVPAELVSTPAALERAQKIILPGVGAFDHGMAALRERGLIAPLRAKALEERVPILGVCLGMQMLGHGSEEGTLAGLGLLDGHCERFRFAPASRRKIPHMGWSLLAPQRESALLQGLDAQSRFYFVHSYHLVCEVAADVLAVAQYDREFVAMVQRDNICGAQFHPEKSHRFGMRLLHNFASL